MLLAIGLKFYDKDGAVVLHTGFNWTTYRINKSHSINLEDGERVIGFKSGSEPNFSEGAFHCNLQLIIGRLV